MVVGIVVHITLANVVLAANIALGKPVTLHGVYGTGGAFCGSPPPAPAASLTDGVFLPESTCWQSGAMWWDANQPGTAANNIVIDLMGQFEITSFSVQADNNDTYRLDYRDPSNNWTTAWDVPTICCFGLTTRTVDLGSPIVATALRFTATSGDLVYSVSEIQAVGVLLDQDGDGIPDSEDACPNSDLSITVIIDSCDSGVANTLFPTGCTLSDLLMQCADGVNNHGEFVSCVAHLTNKLKRAGTITGQQKGAIQSCAARADIP